MDSSNIEYSCIVYNREQSKENVRIIKSQLSQINLYSSSQLLSDLKYRGKIPD
jgi:hypothetical protein